MHYYVCSVALRRTFYQIKLQFETAKVILCAKFYLKLKTD